MSDCWMIDGASSTIMPDMYERCAEYDQMVATVVNKRRNLLVYGEARSGKTRLLQQFAVAQPRAAYVSLTGSLRDVLSGLLRGTAASAKAAREEAVCSTTNMKGLLDKRLDEQAWTLVLDHVDRPSAGVAKLVKDLHNMGRTPVLFAGRSPHMEDIGGFRSLCIEKPSRMELKAWPPALALGFAEREAAKLKLTADNLEEVLKGIASLSAGYPGRMVDMLRMASEGKHLAEGSIKFRTLYLDYIMRGR